MFVWWYIGLIEFLFMSFIYCQNGSPLLVDMDQADDPEVNVVLSITDQEKSSDDVTETDSSNNQTPELFACYECINCNLKSSSTTRDCDYGVNMCYTTHKRINNTIRVVRRGCSTSKGQCTVPGDDQLNVFDSVTCCKSHKCNQSMQLKPFVFLSILSLIMMINI